MEHSYVIEEGIIENYLLHVLNDIETNDFEEHLIYCQECRNLLAETKRIIALNQYIAIHSTKVEARQIAQKKAPIFVPVMKVAAVILIAVCSAGIIWSLLPKPTKSLGQSENNTNPVKNIEDSISTKNISHDSLTNKLAINLRGEKSFRELPGFEAQIGQEYRSEAIEIISPKNMKTFISSENIDFKWQKTDIKLLVLCLYNNQGKLIFQRKISTNYILRQMLQPGLYYWQLETEDDIAYTGKFLVVKSVSNTK